MRIREWSYNAPDASIRHMGPTAQDVHAAFGLAMAHLEATVLIPTHDHGPLLDLAVQSALAQTVQRLEIFIVGDGVPAECRDVVERTVNRDPRIRFFDCPKRGRTGESHRNAVLAQARGRIVCYLADDDLWLPGHVEHMVALLERADFAHTVAVRVRADATSDVLVVDLADARFRQMCIEGSSRIHFSSAGHTLDVFRALPDGWQDAPAGTPTDYHMWRRFLVLDHITAVSGHKATTVVFPSPLRVGWTLEERRTELAAWRARVAQPGFGDALQATAHAAMCASWWEQHDEAERRLAVLNDVHRQAADLRRQVEEKEALIVRLHEAASASRAELERMAQSADETKAESPS